MAGFLFSNNTVKMKQEISEKELEDYICFNKVLENYELKVIARQLKVGSAGILDVLCMNRKTRDLVVVELKKGEINPETQFQANRYKMWLEYYLDGSVKSHWSESRISKRAKKSIATLVIGKFAHKDMFLINSINEAYDYSRELYDYGDRSFYTLANISLNVELGYVRKGFDEKIEAFQAAE